MKNLLDSSLPIFEDKDTKISNSIAIGFYLWKKYGA